MGSSTPEKDKLAPLLAAVSSYDFGAPIGRYKSDAIIQRLSKVRLQSSHHAFSSLRKYIVYSFRNALSYDRHVRVDHPKAFVATSAFVGHLEAMRRQIALLQQTEITTLGTIIVNVPSQFDPNASAESEIHAIEDAARKLLSDLEFAASKISNFLDENIIPDFGREGNRSDGFVRQLINVAVERWPRHFGGSFRRSDLSDLTSLLVVALEDFHYPLTKSQRASDVWLNDRIRKQIFRK